ncbi:MAG: hydrogenase maturation nickel metallochaperone HypA [Nocardiopsaceae bacterium]|nr:hydrogenase maturation nickel metallochaperone HypA [Nocardiopsaceae bacterium]
MHELSLCGSIADIVSRHAEGRTVTVIHVQVGQLRQVVPDTLAFCWEMVSADTALDGSVIEVETVPARMRCRKCGHSDEVGDLPVFACHDCGGIDAEIIAGEEFMVTSLDLAAEPAGETGT